MYKLRLIIRKKDITINNLLVENLEKQQDVNNNVDKEKS